MKDKLLTSFLLTAVLVALDSSAMASTTWYVNGVSGNDNNACTSAADACKTIRHAISRAAAGDSIRVAAATYSEHLIIGISLNLIGSGASTTIIDGAKANTVVTISTSSAKVNLSGVTIQHGLGVNGGGVYNNGALTINTAVIRWNTSQSTTTFADGGGLYNNGTLIIANSTISGNSATSGGGGIQNSGSLTISNSTISGNSTPGVGGGIWNLGTLTMYGTTVSGNTGGRVVFSTGGGIANSRTMSINNSTISGNTIFHHGSGGIENLEGTLTISNSTIAGNQGGINVNLGTTKLQNSIVANNGQNCFGVVGSQGYNLSSDTSCGFKATGDLNDLNPMLGPLQSNGGRTRTQALLAGSPAIDRGNPRGCTDSQGNLLKTDQRGMPRPDKEDTGGCDMGAYERQSD